MYMERLAIERVECEHDKAKQAKPLRGCLAAGVSACRGRSVRVNAMELEDLLGFGFEQLDLRLHWPWGLWLAVQIGRRLPASYKLRVCRRSRARMGDNCHWRG